MAGLGTGLGITLASTARLAASITAEDFLYITAQNGDILIGEKVRGSDSSPAFLVYEPNSGITSDTLAEPTDLLLTQDGRVIQTEDGRLFGVEDKDLPYARYITQDGRIILTQDGNLLVAQEVNPDSTIQEFITQDGRFLFTQSGDQLTTT